MERLTKRIFVPKEERELVVFIQGKYIDTIPAEMTHEDIRKVLRKLAEYEEFEEKLNGVSVKQVVDGFIKTVENQTNEEYERGRILTNAEADEWNEYKQLDEQGLLLRLPCKVGDKVYLICSRYSECSKYKERLDEYNCQGCEEDECDSHKEYYIHINYSVSIEWIVRNLNNFGKTVFLAKAEAEQKLKETESD